MNNQNGRMGWLWGCVWIALALFPGASVCHAQGSDERIVAWVNGEYITEKDHFERMKILTARDFILPGNPITLRAEPAGMLALNLLIDEKLTLQWATKTKDLPAEADINEEWENQKKRPEVAQLLAAKYYTEEMIKHLIKVQLTRYNLATTAITVSAQEVEAFYKKNLASFTSPERWGLAVVRTRKAEDVPKIEAGLREGRPFEELVKRFSDDPNTNQKKGEIGILPATDPGLPAPIKETVKKMKVGEIAGPIKIEAAQEKDKPKVTVWFFVRLLSREPEAVRAFAEIRKQCERLAMLERAGGIQVADKKIADYRKTADIKINVAGYDALLPPQKR